MYEREEEFFTKNFFPCKVRELDMHPETIIIDFGFSTISLEVPESNYILETNRIYVSIEELVIYLRSLGFKITRVSNIILSKDDVVRALTTLRVEDVFYTPFIFMRSPYIIDSVIENGYDSPTVIESVNIVGGFLSRARNKNDLDNELEEYKLLVKEGNESKIFMMLGIHRIGDTIIVL